MAPQLHQNRYNYKIELTSMLKATIAIIILFSLGYDA